MAKTKVKTRGLTDLNVTNAKIAAGTIDVTAKITGVVPAANLGSGTASSSTYLAGDSTYKTISEYDDSQIQSNIALLGFKFATQNSLAKYNLQDQIIDEYEDTSGIDAGNSTNAQYTNDSWLGAITPTQDADEIGADGEYSWYKWTDTTATGSYIIASTTNHEYLIVGAGASGGGYHSGGGGAGGVLTATGLSLTGGNTYTTTVGAGGAAIIASNTIGNDGGDSILSGTGITTLTAGGGGAGGMLGANGADGNATNGSGGGAGYTSDAGSGDGAGYAGGGNSGAGPEYGGGGGGGAGAVGAAGDSNSGGDGGVGVANDIIETGTDVYYAGGGGGAAYANIANVGAGGNGGGGAGGINAVDATSATANTGGGGGGGTSQGSADSGAGGSGIVILRKLITFGEDLTLQSTANTASSAATKADLVMLVENVEGTATINTDIKGYVTADGGSNWTEGTLVDEGSYDASKKIYAFHNATVTSGTDLRYKITTHNQSEGSKETKIHATSLGWS